MLFIESILERKPLVNLHTVKSVTICVENNAEACSIVFDEIVWRGYSDMKQFEEDVKQIKAWKIIFHSPI